MNLISSADELEENEEKYDSVIVKLMNIGESSVNLSEELKNKYSEVDWDGMYKMRNIIAHSYHKVDVNIIWDIAKNELSSDKENVLKILYSSH
ncbi:MAG: HepT-like ribonuclease domain-containing protein [Bacteroidales bacterium]